MGPLQDLREFINHHGNFLKEPSWVGYFLQLQVRKHRDGPGGLQEKYRAELTLMVESGQRAETEALYSHGYDYLGKFIARKIEQAY